MGYGRNNACTANVVFESKGTSVSKSCLPNSGRPAFTPLIGCLADQIQNTDHIIQEDVNKNWIRGGYPSRKCLQSCKK